MMTLNQLNKTEFTAYQLKIIAIMTMIIDHAACVFLFQYRDDFLTIAVIYYTMRCIGRCSFPIFAFLIAEGAIHTKNIDKYIIRLFAAACISEIPYDIGLRNMTYYPGSQNVLWTLLTGLILIKIYQEWLYDKNIAMILITILAGITADKLHFDYGAYGIGIIIIFYFLKNDRERRNLYYVVLSICNILIKKWWPAVFAIPVIFIINKYNERQGKTLPKYFTYAVYPAHLILFFIIKLIIFIIDHS